MHSVMITHPPTPTCMANRLTVTHTCICTYIYTHPIGYEEMDAPSTTQMMEHMMMMIQNQSKLVAQLSATVARSDKQPPKDGRRVNRKFTKFARTNWVKYFGNETLVHTCTLTPV